VKPPTTHPTRVVGGFTRVAADDVKRLRAAFAAP
jgi:hypothetical protein